MPNSLPPSSVPRGRQLERTPPQPVRRSERQARTPPRFCDFDRSESGARSRPGERQRAADLWSQPKSGVALAVVRQPGDLLFWERKNKFF